RYLARSLSRSRSCSLLRAVGEGEELPGETRTTVRFCAKDRNVTTPTVTAHIMSTTFKRSDRRKRRDWGNRVFILFPFWFFGEPGSRPGRTTAVGLLCDKGFSV